MNTAESSTKFIQNLRKIAGPADSPYRTDTKPNAQEMARASNPTKGNFLGVWDLLDGFNPYYSPIRKPGVGPLDIKLDKTEPEYKARLNAIKAADKRESVMHMVAQRALAGKLRRMDATGNLVLPKGVDMTRYRQLFSRFAKEAPARMRQNTAIRDHEMRTFLNDKKPDRKVELKKFPKTDPKDTAKGVSDTKKMEKKQSGCSSDKPKNKKKKDKKKAKRKAMMAGYTKEAGHNMEAMNANLELYSSIMGEGIKHKRKIAPGEAPQRIDNCIHNGNPDHPFSKVMTKESSLALVQDIRKVASLADIGRFIEKSKLPGLVQPGNKDTYERSRDTVRGMQGDSAYSDEIKEAIKKAWSKITTAGTKGGEKGRLRGTAIGTGMGGVGGMITSIALLKMLKDNPELKHYLLAGGAGTAIGAPVGAIAGSHVGDYVGERLGTGKAVLDTIMDS